MGIVVLVALAGVVGCAMAAGAGKVFVLFLRMHSEDADGIGKGVEVSQVRPRELIRRMAKREIPALP